MAKFSEAEVESACVVVASSLGYPTLREQQLRVLLSYIRGNDVFAVLPTGYGKSLCYAVLPMPGCHYTTHGYNKGPGKFVTYNVSVTGSWLCFAVYIAIKLLA